MRKAIAAKLVQFVSWTIDKAYMQGEVKGHKTRENLWIKFGNKFNWLIKVAVFIDKKSAVDEMVKACWWG